MLFAEWEVPQVSTGFSPFELQFGRKPIKVQDLLKEKGKEGPSPIKNSIQYILDLRAKLHTESEIKLLYCFQLHSSQNGEDSPWSYGGWAMWTMHRTLSPQPPQSMERG